MAAHPAVTATAAEGGAETPTRPTHDQWHSLRAQERLRVGRCAKSIWLSDHLLAVDGTVEPGRDMGTDLADAVGTTGRSTEVGVGTSVSGWEFRSR
jgi:hypothetical protein